MTDQTNQGGRKPSPKSYDYTSKNRQQRRRAQLNEIAQAAGFGSWTKLSTAAINGQVEIRKKGE